MQPSHMETVSVGTTKLALRHWGEPADPLIVMLHGWADCSASFQFIVDALRNRWHVVAPDWRGYGGSERRNESYMFLQWVADLDALLQHLSPHRPVRLVAHSLGANVSSIYVGLRPERISGFVNLEGLAPLPGSWPGTPLSILTKWLRGVRERGPNRPYADRAALAARLRTANPRLTAQRAAFLAAAFGRERTDGAIELDMEPMQHQLTPVFGHEEMINSIWPNVTTPVLIITAADSHVTKAFATAPGTLEQRLALLPQMQRAHLEDASHNMHHDQPEHVAKLIETFFAATR